jgi:hypothetical protein
VAVCEGVGRKKPSPLYSYEKEADGDAGYKCISTVRARARKGVEQGAGRRPGRAGT